MIKRSLLGFVAGAFAVLAVHQPIIAGLKAVGVLPPASVAYNMAVMSNAPSALAAAFTSFGFKGWPILFNHMFWGGLWGALYGLALSRLPMRSWLKGLLLGVLVLVAGNWLLVPFFKGGPYWGGLDSRRMLTSAVINIPFGIGVGLIFSILRGRRT